MKVFAVTYGVSYEGEEVKGIFSTLEKAEEFIERSIAASHPYKDKRSDYNIETHEVI